METFSVPEKKISVIAHGAYQLHSSRQKMKDSISVIQFLQFGFIRKYKGIYIVLDAVALIAPEKRKNIRFAIAGKQYSKIDDTDYQGKIKMLGIEDCVSFLPGYIPDEKLPELFKNTDFMLFPYRNVYGSGALLMAYTYEKPVIVSNIPTFREETEDRRTGFIFESENPQELANTILRAAECSSKQIQNYQEAMREMISEKYNWRKSAAKLAEVYQNHLNGDLVL